MATLPRFANLADKVTPGLIRFGYLAVFSETPRECHERVLQTLEDFHSTKGVSSND